MKSQFSAAFATIIALGMLSFSLSVKANTYSHNWPRAEITSTAYPWRTVGKLVDIDKRFCTAFLVGRNLLITKGICVKKDDKLFNGQYQFYPGLTGDQYTSASYKVYPIALVGIGNTSWALLATESPIGQELGYMGLDTGALKIEGYEGDLPSREREFDRDLCRETSSPFKFMSDQAAIQSGKAWAISLDDPKRRFQCSMGVSGDLGANSQFLSSHCGVVGEHDGSWIHDCPTASGSVGSPVFYRELNKFYAVGIHSGSRTDDIVYNVQFNLNNFNQTLKTEAFANAVAVASHSHDPSLASIRIMMEDAILNSLAFATPDEFLNKTKRNICTKQLTASLKQQGLLDASFHWNAEIQKRLARIQKFTYLGVKKRLPARLAVFVKPMSDRSNILYLELTSAFATEYRDWSEVFKGDSKTPCNLTAEQIYRYLDDMAK